MTPSSTNISRVVDEMNQKGSLSTENHQKILDYLDQEFPFRCAIGGIPNVRDVLLDLLGPPLIKDRIDGAFNEYHRYILTPDAVYHSMFGTIYTRSEKIMVLVKLATS